MKDKKVLFISYDGMTDPLGQSQVIPYMQGLTRAGYRIFILSCEKKQAFLQYGNAIQQLLTTDSITWIPIPYTKNPPVISTLLDIFKLKKAAKKIHRENGIDMVHTRPGVPALVGIWMKKTMGIKFLNDIREFYADSRVEGGMWDIKTPVYRSIYHFFKKKESDAVLINDGIVCLTYAAEKIIQEWPEYKKHIPLEVIPCSVDMDLFDPAAVPETVKTNLKTELGINQGDFIVSYLGSIGGWYLTDEMMQFCKILSGHNPSTKILFISPHRHDEIRVAAASHGLDPGQIIIKQATRQEVPKLLSLSDCSVFFIKPCYSKQSSSPTKHGEIMAMGIPLITNSGVGDVETIVEKYAAGIMIREFSEKEYREAAIKTVSGFNFNKANIRTGAIEFYALDNAIKKYIAIYNSILTQ